VAVIVCTVAIMDVAIWDCTLWISVFSGYQLLRIKEPKERKKKLANCNTSEPTLVKNIQK